MSYLIIGLVLGVIADRYVLPLLDGLLEIISYRYAKICTSIQIDTNIMSLDYQEIADQGKDLTPIVGFLGEQQNDEEYYDDEENKKRTNIGFI